MSAGGSDGGRGVPVRAVLLDALGTLVRLEEPWPLLVTALARRGVEVPEPLAREALLQEIAHYRAEHHRAATREALAELRRECADVLADALGAPAARLDPEEVEAALLESLRFRAFGEVPSVLAGLHARGVRLVVLSNWDVSLHEVLHDLGLDAWLSGALSSAEAGVAKPDPAVFAQALEIAGVGPEQALHVGDDLDADVGGALAAGVRPVFVDRSGMAGAAVPTGVAVLSSLTGLPDLVRRPARA